MGGWGDGGCARGSEMKQEELDERRFSYWEREKKYAVMVVLELINDTPRPFRSFHFVMEIYMAEMAAGSYTRAKRVRENW